MSITLYGANGSTYVRTVRMFLAEKGAEYQQVQVDVLKGEPHSPEHLTRHPFGKVPVIDHDGFQVIETGAITTYLNEVLPGPSLVPGNVKDRARANMVMGIYDSYGYGGFVQVAGYHLFPDFLGGQNDNARREGIKRVRQVLQVLMKIKGNDPFLAGQQLSVADLFPAPMCFYVSLTPDAKEVFDVEGFAPWWDRVQALPSFQGTMP
ncbi:glutathione S-transferase family protein [Pseudomonas akapageensis]|uniref:glutathione S-transferase family protein n=1 Tax=Pseudomonas akapageensis TaxID=2609961 RepID=UPI0014073AB5|nr:glutathione S-transferase family protein [Pseudomonas akapageensis]